MSLRNEHGLIPSARAHRASGGPPSPLAAAARPGGFFRP